MRAASPPTLHRPLGASAHNKRGTCSELSSIVYFTDRGIEELAARRGEEDVNLAWLADRLSEFVDLNPDFEVPIERLATWLARLDDED